MLFLHESRNGMRQVISVGTGQAALVTGSGFALHQILGIICPRCIGG